MQIKRFLAGTLAAMTAGATLAMGAFAIDSLGDYVVTDGNTLASPIIVVGDGAGSSATGIVKDVLAAADLAAAVAGYATVPTTVGALGASVSVSNGASLDTPNKKIYLQGYINNATQTLTSNELPTLLASNTVTTQDGDYDYDQYIEIGTRQVTFGNSNEQIDPVSLVNIGTSVGSPLYTAKIVFTKALNFTDIDTPGESVTMFGDTYTISSDSTNTKLVLFGSGQTITLSEGDETIVNVGDTDYTIKLLGVTTATAGDIAVVQVDSESGEITEERSRKIGGLNIFAKDVFYLTKEAQISSATLQLGSQELILEDAKEVKVKIGTSEDSIDNTNVTVTGSADVSSIEIAVAAQDSDFDHVAADATYTDPVFGTFKTATLGLFPAKTSASVETLILDVSGDDDATVKFTDDRGNVKAVSWANRVSDSSIILADSGADVIHGCRGRIPCC